MDLFRAGGVRRHAHFVDKEQLPQLRAQINQPGIFFEVGARLESVSLMRGAQRGSFIGAHSYMNAGGYIRGQVFVGRYCSIGRRVSLGAGTHPARGVSTSPALFPRNRFSRRYTAQEESRIGGVEARDQVLMVGCDVWIGDGAVIMPGLEIGHGAIIASNAVVTKNVEPYQIVGGVPARPIRHRFDQELREGLLRTGWWECAPDQLAALSLGNVFDFIAEFESGQVGANWQTYSLGDPRHPESTP